MYAADLDGDGLLDVLSASDLDDKVAWYRNEGLGSFSPERIITIVADGPRGVFAADLDGDGLLDVLSASVNDNTVAWYRNEGFGNFSSQHIITTEAATVYSVRACDIDGDGLVDVVSGSFTDDKIAWYRNEGGGSFSTQRIITTAANGALAVYTADLDGDGHIDVLSASRYDNKIAWYRNEGAGNFSSSRVVTTLASSAWDVHAADLDGDGLVDVLSASANDNKIAWYRNEGSGNFSAPKTLSTSMQGAISVLAGDVDGDGLLDVVGASHLDDTITWFPNLGGGNFSSPEVITSTADNVHSVYAADLDGDGLLDVLSAAYSANMIAWYRNENMFFSPPQLISQYADGATSVHAADLDGDGLLDVLSASFLDNKIAWYRNQGAGLFSTQKILSTSLVTAWAVSTSDLDGDGLVDVLSASNNDNKIAWYRNEGFGRFSAQKVITTAADGAISVYATDLDGDGLMDVLSASYRDNRIAWYQNKGAGTFSSQKTITTSASYAYYVYAGDLDNDGLQDVLSASFDDDTIAWYRNEGNGLFSSQNVITTSADGASAVHAADLDGDGLLDVLSSSYSDNKIAWYRNEGSKISSAQNVISEDAKGAVSVYAKDLDGDGRLDVLSASFLDGKVAWYRNEGKGNFSAPRIITTSAAGARSVFAADLDGDGFQEVLSASESDDTVAWYAGILQRFDDYKLLCILMDLIPSWRTQLNWGENCEHPAPSLRQTWDGITARPHPSSPQITHIELANLQHEPSNLVHLSLLTSLTSLEFLSLRKLKAEELPSQWSSFHTLRHLDVSYNRLTELPTQWTTLTTLTSLDVSGNQLKRFDLDMILSWPSLRALHVSHNQNLSVLHVDSIFYEDWFDENEGFNGSHSEGNDSCPHSSALTTLDLSYCNISQIIGVASYLSNIKDCNLSYNAIAEAEVLHSLHLPSAEAIDLRGNRLTEYPLQVYKVFPNLSVFMVQRNPLRILRGFNSIHECLRQRAPTHPITRLDLSALGIQEARGVMCYLDELETLDLARNDLATLGGVWAFPNLRTLNLNSNRLHAHVFPQFPALVNLVLSNNRFEALQVNGTSIFHRLPLLRSANLSHNPLADLEDTAFRAVALERLDLSWTSVSHVQPGAWEALNLVADVDIDGTALTHVNPCIVGQQGKCMGTFEASRTVFCIGMQDGEYCRSSRGSRWCEEGFVCSEGIRQPCPTGKFSSSGMSTCSPCPSGRFSDSPASGSCSPCERGYFCLNGERQECPVGTISKPSASECTACSPGTYTSSNASTVCTLCEAGHFCPGGSNREACLAHHFSGAGAAGCEPCPAGTYSSRGAAQCSSCPEGQTFNASLLTSEADGFPDCEPCPEGTVYIPPSDDHQVFPACTTCPAGFGCPGGASTAVPCPRGRYSSRGSSLECTPCPMHTMGRAGNLTRRSIEISCQACPVGRFTNSTGQTACLACPSGTLGVHRITHGSSPCTNCTTSDECAAGVLRPVSYDFMQLRELADGSMEVLQTLPSTVMGASEPLPTLTKLRRGPAPLASSSGKTAALGDDEGHELVKIMIYSGAGVTCIIIALILLLNKARVKVCLNRIDIFNLDHPLKPREVMSSHPTFTGGLFTVATLLIVIALLVNAMYDYFSDGNRLSTMTVVPVAELPAQGTDYISFVFHVYGDDPFLDGSFGMETPKRPSQNQSAATCPLVVVVDASQASFLPPLACSKHVTKANDQMACSCSVVSTSLADRSIQLPFFSALQFKLHLRATAFAGQLTVHSATSNYSVLEFAGPLRTLSGIPEGADIHIRALPDVVDDRVSSRQSTGYTLFSQSAAFVGNNMRMAFEGTEWTAVTIAIQEENLGRITEINLKSTAMQAISASFGLIIGSLGALRVLFRYTRKTHRRVKTRKAKSLTFRGPRGKAKSQKATALQGNPRTAELLNMGSLQEWRANPIREAHQ